jgi:hypothetical protein
MPRAKDSIVKGLANRSDMAVGDRQEDPNDTKRHGSEDKDDVCDRCRDLIVKTRQNVMDAEQAEQINPNPSVLY